MLLKQEIERFIHGTSSLEEAAKIKAELDLLREDFGVLDEAEWNGFVPTEDLASEVSEKMLVTIQQLVTKPSRFLILVKRISVAAVVIGSIVFGWWFFRERSNWSQDVMVSATTTIPTRWITRENQSGKLVQFVLDDHSKIVLYGHSKLRYPEHFGSSNRDVQLIGEADFNVAKDKSRPFTVYGGGVLTTVLGTQFNIKAERSSATVRVRLFEGSILVKTDTAIMKKDSMVLTPGQEYFLDKVANKSWLRKMQPAVSESNSNKAHDRKQISATLGNAWFKFDNEPLEEVFDQLSEMYGVPIRYNRQSVQKMYFIGKFERTDSIFSILKTITELNRLKLEQKAGGYIISK